MSRNRLTTQVARAKPRATGRVQRRGQDGDRHGAEERQEGDDREDRDRADVHQRFPARIRYDPAMTMSPTAMPSA